MYKLQKYLPPIFFNAQEHYLIHQVEEIEICGPIHIRSMWKVERHLKTLKDFFIQRSHPKCSMVNEYMVYQSVVYISEYIHEVASPHINVPHIWDVDSKKKYEGDFLLGNGRMTKFKGNQTVDHINLYNSVCCILSISYFINLIKLFIHHLLRFTMNT